MEEPNRLEMYAKLILLLKSVFELFFPLRCTGCQREIISPQKVLCIHCELNLPLTYFHLICPSPLKNKHFAFWGVQEVFAIYRFEKSTLIETLLYQLKYHKNRAIGVFFGRKLALFITTSEQQFDGIIGVPLHPRRKRKRGYNQVDIIGQSAAACLAIPYYGKWLERIKHTPKLSTASKDRNLILKEAFRVHPKYTIPKGHYLLIDDILTTGATLKACLSVLKEFDHISLSIATMVYRN